MILRSGFLARPLGIWVSSGRQIACNIKLRRRALSPRHTFMDSLSNNAHHSHSATTIDKSDLAGEHLFAKSDGSIGQVLVLWRARAAEQTEILDWELLLTGHVDGGQ